MLYDDLEQSAIDAVSFINETFNATNMNDIHNRRALLARVAWSYASCRTNSLSIRRCAEAKQSRRYT